MPQLDPISFPSQIFWLTIVFGAFYMFIVHVALPRISNVIEYRVSRINNDIEQAEAFHIQSKKAKEAYERELSFAKNHALTQMHDLHKEIEKDIIQRHGAMDAIIAKKYSDAEKNIREKLKDYNNEYSEQLPFMVESLLYFIVKDIKADLNNIKSFTDKHNVKL